MATSVSLYRHEPEPTEPEPSPQLWDPWLDNGRDLESDESGTGAGCG